MKTKVFTIIGTVLLLAGGAALADSPLAPTQEEVSVTVNWSNLQQSVATLMRAYQALSAENGALKKHITDLDEYLKACGDKPGCTVPVKSK